MEPHRMSGSPEMRIQRGYMQKRSPRNSPDNLFGVRVQVQGIKGHPYVVLNNNSQESARDFSVPANQSDYNLVPTRGSPLATSVAEGRADIRHQFADSFSEFREPERTTASNALNYQRHPELLRPYDPEINNLNVLIPSPTTTASRSEQLHPGPPPQTTRAANLSKARIPLPAEGPAGDQNENHHREPPLGNDISAKSPNSVDTDTVSSVGKLIDRFNSSQPRRVRFGPRNRVDPDERRRSRSVDSRQRSDSSASASPSASPSASSFSSSRASSSLKGIRARTPGGASAPGSPRSSFYGAGDTSVASGTHESSSTAQLFKGPHGKESTSPQMVKVLRVEKSSLSQSVSSKHADETQERDTQVTPDLLKGQQELSADSDEETTKQILFFYLKDGTTDNDSTTEKKVNMVFDGMNKLKWKPAENVGEEKDHAAEANGLQEKQKALEYEVSELQKQLDVEIKNEKTLAKACEKARTERKSLTEELDRSQTELSTIRARLAEIEAELQSTKQELARLKAERDRSRTEMKDLQHQLSEMHDELDRAKEAEVENAEKEVLLQDMAQLRDGFHELLQGQEEQEDLLQQRERELVALKGALKEEVEANERSVTALKEEHERAVQELLAAVDQAKENNTLLGQEKAAAEAAREATNDKIKALSQERTQLREQAQQLENKMEELQRTIQGAKTSQLHLEQRANQLEKEKRQVERALMDVRQKEEEMSLSNQSLITRLEDVQCELTKLNHEHRELKEKLREEQKQVEELWKMKQELEEEKKLQDRTVQQLQRKMTNIMEECEISTDKLQRQVNEARERSQKEVTHLRSQLEEKGAELDKCRNNAKKLQEELLSLERDMQQCRREQQEAQLRSRQLAQKVEELEERDTLEERGQQVKLMERRISQLEEDLCEERGSADRLMDRIDKSKEQMDQMRTELQQERAVRQDLECDKISLERQNKDLRSRVTHLEGFWVPNQQDSAVSKLNGRIQELEERLQGEKRETNNVLQANRKLERKMREMKMQVDEETIALQSHSDQLTQRLKTAKRQMDEAEEEIERLEHAKKKLQRDLDEQMEANEQLHGQLSALRNERHKKKSTRLTTTVDDFDDADDLASD